jgi:hypothetical protein
MSKLECLFHTRYVSEAGSNHVFRNAVIMLADGSFFLCILNFVATVGIESGPSEYYASTLTTEPSDNSPTPTQRSQRY